MNPQAKKLMKHAASALAAIATLSLAGCGLGTTSQNASAIAMGTISGTVHGGQQPVSGSHVYLFAVATTGYGTGNNASPLLNSPGYVTTTAGGGFSITGQYTCPSNAQVYLAAEGGNPGLAAGTNNQAISLVAGLGSCSALTSATNIDINEVSTAAMAYALSGFASNYVQVSTSQTNIAGISRAFASIPNMINVASGNALSTTPAGNGTVPTAEINTLADIIAPCVNSNGSDGTCNTLFSATTPSGGNAPTQTFGALLNIAQNPAMNVAQLFSLVTANAPFQPTLSAAPNDWTLAINYNGLSQPYGLTIDTGGSVWTSSSGNNTVTELSFLGAPQATYSGNGLSTPLGIASDTLGNILVANSGNNTLTRISNAGIVSSFNGGGLNGPSSVAIDGNNTIWVGNRNGNSMSEFFSSGSAANANGITGGGISAPTGIAVDSTGQIFTANSGNSSISKYTPSSGAFASGANGYTGGGLSQPVALAFDGNNNIYLPNASSTVSFFTDNGAPASNSPFTGGGTGAQGGVAVDGLGNAFVTDTNNSIKVILSGGNTIKSPSTGFQASGLNGPARLAIDLSGNVWVANNGTGATSITEFVGLAAPTQTPLSYAVGNGGLGKRP